MEPSLDNYKLCCELTGHSMDVRSVTAGREAPEGQIIISGSRDKSVIVWKRTGNEYSESITYKDHKNFIACVYYLEAEQWICTGSNDATIAIYKEDGYVPLVTIKGHESTVCSMTEGVQPRSIVSGSWDNTARIWKIDEMGSVSHVELRGHEAAVWAVASMPSVRKVITASADKCIFYWNDKGEKLRILKGHTDCVRGLITLRETSFVSCSNDAIIRYWNDDGDCTQELNGHTNYIYDVAQNKALGEEIIVSCGEDSTLRMWNLASGKEMGSPIEHPACSVWSVACLNNGDIVTGCSDGVVRVFTKDATRFANEKTLTSFNMAVEARKQQSNETLGGYKKTDLLGPEALLITGNRDGQTRMIRHKDGSVKCYSWGNGQWNLIGDVTGASGGSQSTSGKKLFEGKEYDYVFTVDISDTMPPIKLPYNRGEDPWHVAQEFIHRHFLPQSYLEQVANFIIKNSDGAANVAPQPTNSAYQDPFTGGARYVPGSSQKNVNSGGNMDPFTGGSSYSTNSKINVNFVRGSDKHFPVSKYVTFDGCDTNKVLEKLKEFNSSLVEEKQKVSVNLLEVVIQLAMFPPQFDSAAIEALLHLLSWPQDILFPVLDVIRLAVRDEDICSTLFSQNTMIIFKPLLKSSPPNQLMLIRCLTNMMSHVSGRSIIIQHLTELIADINTIKSGTPNLQIAIATFYLNLTITETLGKANGEHCFVITEGIVDLLKWAIDLESCYRSMQAIGNLTTTPFGQETTAQVISVDYVMDKIRELTNTPQKDPFAKINSVGTALLAAF